MSNSNAPTLEMENPTISTFNENRKTVETVNLQSGRRRNFWRSHGDELPQNQLVREREEVGYGAPGALDFFSRKRYKNWVNRQEQKSWLYSSQSSKCAWLSRSIEGAFSYFAFIGQRGIWNWWSPGRVEGCLHVARFWWVANKKKSEAKLCRV